MSDKNRRILLVDDEPDIRKIGRIALADVGDYQIETASDGQSVPDKVRSFEPDILLLDVMMPGIDGPGVIANLKSEDLFERVDVVMLTAKVQPREVERYKELGAIGVIEKPFNPMTLAERIDELIHSE